MESGGVEAVFLPSRGQEWDSLRLLVRQLEEERDLEGLVAISEMGLMALRLLCERPVTCAGLDDLLSGLRRLQLDSWEQEDS